MKAVEPAPGDVQSWALRTAVCTTLQVEVYMGTLCECGFTNLPFNSYFQKLLTRRDESRAFFKNYPFFW